MEILDVVKALPDWSVLAWLAICLLVSLLLEAMFPLKRFVNQKLKHDAFNVGLFVMNLIIVSPLVAGLGIVALWVEANQIGLLYQINLSVWAELLLAILVLDLIAQYAVHYVLHHVNWMWRLHVVHHADTNVDASTGTRHHPGDLAFRLVAASTAIILFGIPAAFYLVYRFLSGFFSYFTHANIHLPPELDRLLSYIIVTPNMHKLHHHYQAPWTDSNFGNLFSFWDRLFGTFDSADAADIHYGLDILDGNRDLDVLYQLQAPFDKTIDTRYRPGMTS